jgi:glucose/arabinose dehydrogenase
MRRPAALVLAGSMLLAGCGGSDDSASPSPRRSSAPSASTSDTPSGNPSSTPTSESPTHSTRPEVIGVVAKNLEVPWGIAFLPDDSALVTERDSGRVLHIVGQRVTPVGSVDALAHAAGESGLLGIAVSPSYDRDHRVFLYATTSSDTRGLRSTFQGGRLGRLDPILTGIPAGPYHDGGRLAFGPDGMLYVSTGEAGEAHRAQERSSLGGKILRITQDGDPAPGNPDPGSPVWTWGHRNVQGLAFDPDGNLWASEFGQDTFDELNLIRKGHNYGWPLVEGKGDAPGMTNPEITWATDDASPSGLAFLDGRLWLGALRGERLWRIDVKGRKASHEKAFFVGRWGRMRTVVAAPDGNLWVTTSNHDGRGEPSFTDDRILLVRP